MKRKLLYLCALLCIVAFLPSCKDDKTETPPTPEDVVAEYAGENLKATIDGIENTDENVKIALATAGSSDSVTVKLFNIVPGVSEFNVKGQFSAVTKSAYISTFSGTKKDNVSGYTVKVSGTVDEGVLTAAVTLTEIQTENTNTADLIGLVYKGDMKIDVAGMSPVSMEQRVYLTKSRKHASDSSMVKMTIKNFAFENIQLGSIVLDTVLIQKRGEVLPFNVEGQTIKLTGIGEVVVNMTGYIIGEDMTLKLAIDASGLQVGVTFNGTSVTENKEAKVTEMSVPGAAVVDQKFSSTSYTLRVWDNTSDDQLLLTPVYKLSDKATVDSVLMVLGKEKTKLTDDQVNGKQPIDFSLLKNGTSDYLQFYIAAEDPNTKGYFKIYVERMASIDTKFTFTKWNASGKYFEPEGWATSNTAATFLMGMKDDDGNPFYPANTPYPISQSGNNAKIITVYTKGYNTLIPAITAGSLFLGKFSTNLTNTLKSTQFGVPYSKKPVTFKGTYQYTAGPKYLQVKSITENKVEVEEVAGKTDQCALTVVLYEVTSYDETLDGTNLQTADNIVARAAITNETTTGFVSFEEPITYRPGKSFDASKKYKLAVVCSSSVDGAAFKGAPDSELLIQSLEIVNE